MIVSGSARECVALIKITVRRKLVVILLTMG
jgi:hypothetical protein